MIASSLLLASAGLALLALSMQRHAAQAGWPRTAPGRAACRIGGWGALAGSAALRIAGGDWPVALVEWTGIVGLAAALVTLTLTYRPTFARTALAPLFILAALLAALLAAV